AMDCGDHFDAHRGGVEGVAVGEGEVDGGERLAVIGVFVGVFLDGDSGGRKGDARDISGVERGGKGGSVEEGRCDVFERHGGSTAYGNVGELKQLGAGVERGGID